MSLIRRAGKRALTLIGRGAPPTVPAVGSNTFCAPGNQWHAPAIAGASTFADAAMIESRTSGTAQVWRDLLSRQSKLSGFTYDEIGCGVGFAIRYV
jgi:hypothetical protein